MRELNAALGLTLVAALARSKDRKLRPAGRRSTTLSRGRMPRTG